MDRLLKKIPSDGDSFDGQSIRHAPSIADPPMQCNKDTEQRISKLRYFGNPKEDARKKIKLYGGAVRIKLCISVIKIRSTNLELG